MATNIATEPATENLREATEQAMGLSVQDLVTAAAGAPSEAKHAAVAVAGQLGMALLRPDRPA